MTIQEHIEGCDGGGGVDCWDCDDGTVYRQLSDMPDDTEAICCQTCGGTGWIECEACK
jgi:hypothetical protein